MSVAKSRRRCEAYAQAMRLPGRTDYALRAALELAASPDGPVTTDELSHRQDIPTSYLGAILAELRKAGIVHARRGAEGGWTLARAATEISLADVPSLARCTDADASAGDSPTASSSVVEVTPKPMPRAPSMNEAPKPASAMRMRPVMDLHPGPAKAPIVT